MGYDNDHYNYQVAVIFAILVGGLLLLGLCLAGIWVVVKNMRAGDDKKRLQPSRNSNGGGDRQWNQQSTSYNAPFRDTPTAVNPYYPGIQQQQEYIVKTPVAPSPQVNTGYPNYNSQYNQQGSLATPTNQDYINNQRVTQLNPDVIYTQGPSGFVQQTPVEYNQSLPTYHQSSV